MNSSKIQTASAADNELAAIIDYCRPWIEAALARSAESHYFEDVKQAILDNRAQIWPSQNGCIVTTVTEFPKSKMLQVWLCGGDFDEVFNKYNDMIEEWGRKQGCDQMFINGRKGWERRLKDVGYHPVAVILTKEL